MSTDIHPATELVLSYYSLSSRVYLGVCAVKVLYRRRYGFMSLYHELFLPISRHIMTPSRGPPRRHSFNPTGAIYCVYVAVT